MIDEQTRQALTTIEKLSQNHTNRIKALQEQCDTKNAELQIAKKEIEKYKNLYEEALTAIDKVKAKYRIDKVFVFIIIAVLTAIIFTS